MAEGDLTAALQGLVQRSMEAASLTDLEIGTVTGVEPLEVTVQAVRDPIPATALLLTEAVVEKKLPVLEHTHITDGFSHLHQITSLPHTHTLGSTTSTALAGSYPTEIGLRQDAFESDRRLLEGEIVCLEHGKPLPVRDGYILLNRGLEVGDKVLMLKVLGGQSHIILSRIFEVR